MGRRYEIEEWGEFEMAGYADGEAQERDDVSTRDIEDGLNLSDPGYLQALERFTKHAERLADKYGTDEEDVNLHSDDDIAYHTFAVISGSGIEGVPYDGPWWRAIQKDKPLRGAYSNLENKMIELVYDAAERAAR